MSDTGKKYVSTGATISPDGRYRYRLWREWRLHPKPAQWDMWTDDGGKPVLDGAGQQLGNPKSCVFVMLNPSTADGDEDDPTIRRCVGYAKAWGYDRLEVINLFAFRATDPRALLALNWEDDAVGPDNRQWVDRVMCGTDYPPGIVVCAWGNHGAYLDQDETMLGWLDCATHALRLTRDGHPAHPLYLPADLTPVPFGGRARRAA